MLCGLVGVLSVPSSHETGRERAIAALCFIRPESLRSERVQSCAVEPRYFSLRDSLCERSTLRGAGEGKEEEATGRILLIHSCAAACFGVFDSPWGNQWREKRRLRDLWSFI